MPIARGQISFVDLNDGKTINLFLGANRALTQIYDVDEKAYVPDYSASPFLVVTPEVFVSGETTSQLANLKGTPTWKINGVTVTSSTPNVVIGNLAANYALTIKRNLTNETTLTIECSCIYQDPHNSAETQAKATITFTKFETTGELIRAIAYAPRGTVFKNDTLDYLLLHCDMYRGSQIDNTNVTYQWYRRDNSVGVDGAWMKIVANVTDPNTQVAAGTITGYTTNELKIMKDDVLNYDVFQCVCTDTDSTSATYSLTCADVLSVFDITDPYMVDFEFPAGTTLTRGMESTEGTVFLWQNGSKITTQAFYAGLTYSWTKYGKTGLVDTSPKYKDAAGTSDPNWTDGHATIAGASGRKLIVFRDELDVAGTYAVEISETV